MRSAHHGPRVASIPVVYQNKSPWGILGTRIPGASNVSQAIAGSALDYRVELAPLAIEGQIVPDRQATIRIDPSGGRSYLATVGNAYTPLQNAECFDILQPLCDQHGVTIESMLSTHGGRTAALIAKLPDSTEIADGDRVSNYFVLRTGHDGLTKFHAMLTPYRPACWNVLNSLSRSAMFAIPHTASGPERVKAATALLSAMVQAAKDTGETYRTLATRRLTMADVAAYIERVLPADGDITPTLERRRARVADLVWNGKGAAMAGSDSSGSTLWACYNAITEYYDHVRPAEFTGLASQTRANESALWGPNAAIKQTALAVARELAYA